jgi:prophage tail gpP-like protein
MAIRSKTADLVDCSVDVDALAAVAGSWAITAGTVGSAAKLITSPYDIAVESVQDVALNIAYPIAVPPGATCWQILEELGRVTQRLIYDAPDGSLVISPVGTAHAACGLAEGVNMEYGTARLSSDQRYSKVVVFAQDTFLDTQDAPYLGFKQTATDNSVPRNRLLMIPTDLPGPNGLYAQQRANWEVARRYGRSRQVQITVTGFRDSAGALWEVNTVVNIRALSLKIISEDMVIARVEFVLDERGSRTTLTCMPRAGLVPQPFMPGPPFAIIQADARRAAAGQNAVATGNTT